MQDRVIQMKGKKKHKGLKTALGIVGGLLLALVLTFVTLMYVIPAFETADRTAVEGSANWMRNLNDNRYISEVVLPGTHDSGTANAQLAFFSKCQALSVGEQLAAGFRYLDIRLGMDGGKLKLMHGFTNCVENGWPWAGTLYLETVLQQCYDFLKANPSEFVVFAVKKEHGDESVTDFERALDAVILQNRSYWLLTDTIPTVGEARGKLVLMRRYPDEAGLGKESGIGLNWADQGSRSDTTLHAAFVGNGTYSLWVQDRYKYETEEKWEAFVSGMQTGQTGPDAVSLHFLSTNGSPKFGHPYRYAAALNKRLLQSDFTFRGWVILDFASPTLAERIFSNNILVLGDPITK